MISSNRLYFSLLAILLVPALFLIGERLGEGCAAYILAAKWFALPLLTISFFVLKRKDYPGLLMYCLNGCVIASICLLSAAHCIIIFNKHVGESRSMTLSGDIVETKPGKGGGDQRMRDVVLMTPNGLVRINIIHHLFEKNRDGTHFSINCRVGSLVLLFL